MTFVILPELNDYLHGFSDYSAGAICVALLICKIDPLSSVSFSNSGERQDGKGPEIRIKEFQDLHGPQQAYIDSSHCKKE